MKKLLGQLLFVVAMWGAVFFLEGQSVTATFNFGQLVTSVLPQEAKLVDTKGTIIEKVSQADGTIQLRYTYDMTFEHWKKLETNDLQWIVRFDGELGQTLSLGQMSMSLADYCSNLADRCTNVDDVKTIVKIPVTLTLPSDFTNEQIANLLELRDTNISFERKGKKVEL